MRGLGDPVIAGSIGTGFGAFQRHSALQMGVIQPERYVQTAHVAHFVAVKKMKRQQFAVLIKLLYAGGQLLRQYLKRNDRIWTKRRCNVVKQDQVVVAIRAL